VRGDLRQMFALEAPIVKEMRRDAKLHAIPNRLL
jgi:hypothetical protein